jgi:hypothetical protein
MPPKGKLAEEELGHLRRWLEQGAWMPEDSLEVANRTESFDIRERARHWSYQPVHVLPTPTSALQDEDRSPIDAFLEVKRRERDLGASARALPSEWLRRATFDLTGLPPTAGEIAAFLADPREDGYEREVDRLLASPRHGERWGRHWLDWVRYAETLGHEFDYDLFHAWQYRDYIVRALNADVPYDDLVREHVAGDLLAEPRRDPTTGMLESPIGTAFFWFGDATHSPVDVRQAQLDRIDNQIDVLSKAFLAQTVACARCHDHKFDAISQRDYYALAGFLKSSRYAVTRREDPAERERQADDLLALGRQSHAVAWGRLAKWHSLAEESPPAGAVENRPLPEAAKSVDHPLYAWYRLAGDAPGTLADRFKLLQRDWADRRTVIEAERSADQEIEVGESWMGEGADVDQSVVRPGFRVDVRGDLPTVQWIRGGGLRTSEASKRIEMTLRSPTYTIERDYLHLKGAGRGGRINVVVDGFALIRDPIYGGLTTALKSDSPVWRTIDLRKWRGHRVYLELVDSATPNLTEPPPAMYVLGDAWVELERAVFSDRPAHPTEPMHPMVEELLASSAPANLVAWADRYDSIAQRGWFHLAGDKSADALTRRECDEIWWAYEWQRPLPTDWGEEVVGRWREIADAKKRIEDHRTVALCSPGMADGTGEDEVLLHRGNSKNPGSVIPRRHLEVLGGQQHSASHGSGRRELADQLVDPDGPLAARVIVNRLWHHHFGAGIVRSPDDFGKMGQPPTHPELLDWLADECVRADWSLKHLHREMVASRLYRMSSTCDSTLRERDPLNESWTRMPIRRLEAESIRDGMLAVSGRLDLAMGGPGVMPFLTEYMEPIGRPGVSGPLDGGGRRSIYQAVRRNFLAPLLLAFDYPLPQTTIGRRTVSNVPAQALAMMNDPFVIEQARQWSDQLLRESSDAGDRLDLAYRVAFGRDPSKVERERLLPVLASASTPDGQRSAWHELCHALLNAKEFIFVP